MIWGIPTSAGGDEVLGSHGNWNKLTRGAIGEGERFQGVRTPRHQTYHQIDFCVEEHRADLGEVETTGEVQQLGYGITCFPEHPQTKGPGEVG